MSAFITAPPDHILLVEDEFGLCQNIHAEIFSRLGKRVETCYLDQLAKNPELVLGAQAVAPDYALDLLNSLVSQSRPCIQLTFSGVDGHVALIRDLAEPSIIGIVSASEALLNTERSLLATALDHRQALREFQLPQQGYSVRASFLH